MNNCMICERIDLIRKGENPYFARELHFLEPEFRARFLYEMSVVAEAVYHAFDAEKLEILKTLLNTELDKLL